MKRIKNFDYNDLIMNTDFYLTYMQCRDLYFEPDRWELTLKDMYVPFLNLSALMRNKYGWDKLEDFLVFAIDDLERLSNDLVLCKADRSIFYREYNYCKSVFNVLLYVLRQLIYYGGFNE